MTDKKTSQKTNTKTKARNKPMERKTKKVKSLEAQRQGRIQKLGVDNPRCGLCGHSEPLALEEHHIAGQKYDEATGILCRNCHRVQSAKQNLHPDEIQNGQDKSLFEMAGHFLLGLADFLEVAIGKLREIGRQLIEKAHVLCKPNQEAVI